MTDGRQLGAVHAQPFRGLVGSNGFLGRLERIALEARLADLDAIAHLELIGGHVRDAAVHGEVTVVHELARLRPRDREAAPEHDVVEAQLEHPQEVLAGDSGTALGHLEVVA